MHLQEEVSTTLGLYIVIYLFLAALGLHCFVAFHYFQRVRAASHCGAWASHCAGFSRCRAQALGACASVVAAHRLSICSSQALQHELGGCGTGA